MFPGSKITIAGKEFLVLREFTSSTTARSRVKGHTITIQIPRSCQREEGFRLFVELAHETIKKLEKHPERVVKVPITFRDGQEVSVLGKTFSIRAVTGEALHTSSARLDGNTITIRLAAHLDEKWRGKHTTALARRLISNAVLPQLHQRVGELNKKHFQVPVRRVGMKDTTSLWGSCSGENNISLSFRLLFAPPEILDSVIIHELAHMKEHNHSSAFWALVEQADPGHHQKRMWLNKYGNQIGPSFASPEAMPLQ